MLEREALQELHGNELAIFVTADFINGADIGMVQRRGGTGFAAEALQGLWVLGDVVGKEFQSDEAPQIDVFGFIYDTHPATAELLDDAVMRDGQPDHWAEILGLRMS